MDQNSVCNGTTTRENELRALADEAFDILYEVLNDAEGWEHDRGDSIETGIVSSKMYDGIGRVTKLKVHLDATADQIKTLFIDQVDQTPQWNNTMAITKTVERIADDLMIMYFATKDAFIGFISPRDFVNLRHIRTVNNATYLPNIAITHPDLPPTDAYVRGFHKSPSGSMFTALPDNPNKVLLVTTSNVDIQMWVPEFVVKNQKPKSMMEFVDRLREKLKEMNQQ